MTLDAHAVLQAGGRGERFRPATDLEPKALLPVGGRPMIERLLYQLLDCGIRTVTVVVGWRGERIEAHLAGLRGLPADLTLRFVREVHPAGNAGALRGFAREARPVILAFADLVTDLPFGTMLRLHRERGCDVTLASHYESHRVRLGELVARGDSVLDYLEKPEKRFLICSGVAVFEPRVLALIPPDRPTGLSDLVRSAIAGGFSVTHWVHGAPWVDVNAPDDLAAAEAVLAARPSPDLAPARTARAVGGVRGGSRG